METWGPTPGVTSGPNLVLPCHLGGFYKYLTEDSTRKSLQFRDLYEQGHTSQQRPTLHHLALLLNSLGLQKVLQSPGRDHWAPQGRGHLDEAQILGDSLGSGLP